MQTTFSGGRLAFRPPKLLVLLVWLLGCVPALATPAAELHGKVVDENGVPVAGVEVTIQTCAGKTQTARTDEGGRFIVRELQSGTCRVSLERPGFFRLVDAALALEEGVNEVSFTLNHAVEVHEEIEVRSSANRIDPTETARSATLQAQEIRDIPVPSTHDLQSSLPALPGVLRDAADQLHVVGARPGATQIVLDGFEISDPRTGSLTARVAVDAVRTVTVESAGLGAQFAHPGAAVLALDTAAGDDRWRFGTTNFIPSLDFQQGTHFGDWYPRFTLSGPLRKGRAWFSEALSVQHTFSLVSEQPRGANTISQWAGDSLLRLQVNLSSAHILQANFLYNHENDSNLGLNPFAPLSTTTDVSGRRYFVSLRDQVWLSNALLAFGGAFDSGRRDRVPQGNADYILTPTGSAGNFFETTRQHARRWQFFTQVSLPSRQWHGAHDLQFGGNADGTRISQTALRNPIQTLRQDDTLLEFTTFSGTGAFRLSNQRWGVYAQDTWRILQRLLVQVGVRLDGNDLVNDPVAGPRVAVNLLPWRDERARLTLSWGLYAAPVDLGLLGQALDQTRTDLFFDATGTVPIIGPAASRFALPSTGLRLPRFATASAEWRQQLTRRTLLALHLLARDERDGLTYAPQDGGAAGVFLLGNGRRDRYRAGEISVRHAFSDKAEMTASFTRSRASTNAVLDYSLAGMVFSSQSAGPLAWDAPNRLISTGWAPLPIWGLLGSYFFEYRTGFPFSALNEQQQLVGPANGLRFPDYVSLNLAIEKKFRFRGAVWAVRLTAVNMTGHENPNSVVNNTAAPNFLTFAGGQGRAFNARLRFVGRK